MPLDPFLETDIRNKSGEPRFSDLDHETARKSKAGSRMQLWPGAGPCVANDVAIPMDWGICSARLYRPEATGVYPLVVVFHGGGFVICDIETHDGLARGICGGAGVAVLSVDYRLAPENRFPAGLEDAVASIRWAVAQADNLQIDPKRIVLFGDSAGGNLAVAAGMRLGAATDVPPLAGLALCHPVLDAPNVESESYRAFSEGYGLTRRDMEWFWAHYMGENNPVTPEAAPLRAPDIGKCPPTLVMTAEYDVLRDEGEAFAARLFREGVLVTGRRYAGVNHNFIAFSASVPRAGVAMADLCAWIRGRTEI